MSKSLLHALAGTTALLLVITFWTSTVVSKLWFDMAAVQSVKQAIAHYGLLAMVLCMAATGASGFSLGRGRSGRLLDEKKRRMQRLGMNGLLLMVPAAWFLHTRASAGQFDALFYTVQVLELCVGVVQMVWLGQNVRDGLRLSGRLRRKP